MLKVNGFTKLISKEVEIFIDYCDGTKTIANSSKIFDLCIDGDFLKEDFNKTSKAKKRTQVNVFEVVKNSTLAQIFGSLYENCDLDKLCLTQHQVSVFCKDNKNWLRGDTYGTLFLVKMEFNYYVLHVIMGSSRLAIHRYHLGDSDVKWQGACLHRVVARCNN